MDSYIDDGTADQYAFGITAAGGCIIINTLAHEFGHNFGSINVPLVVFSRLEQEIQYTFFTDSESSAVADVISQEKTYTLLQVQQTNCRKHQRKLGELTSKVDA